MSLIFALHFNTCSIKTKAHIKTDCSDVAIRVSNKFCYSFLCGLLTIIIIIIAVKSFTHNKINDYYYVWDK